MQLFNQVFPKLSIYQVRKRDLGWVVVTFMLVVSVSTCRGASMQAGEAAYLTYQIPMQGRMQFDQGDAHETKTWELFTAQAADLVLSTQIASTEQEYSEFPPPIDPQSARFLDAIRSPSRPVVAMSGTELRLWGHVQFAELPDWDPSLELHRIHTRWEQIAGPPVNIQDPEGTKTVALLPEVSSVLRLEFRLTMKNASGTVTRTLVVDLRPRP